MKKLPFYIFAFLAITITHLLNLEAQQKGDSQELQHEVTVTLKLIQVYVMDKNGNPITDLRPEEFKVFDNKKLQNITEFERYVLFPTEDSKESTFEAKNIDHSDSQDEVLNRKFFLFFDLANNSFKGFQKAQDAALYFIDNQVHPSDEVGVLSFSVLKGLTLHEYFTKDLQAIRSVVEQLGKSGRIGRADNFEALIWREFSGESALDASQASKPIKKSIPAQLVNPEDVEQDSPNIRFQREMHKGQIRHLMSKIIDLSKALRYIPGQKHIIFFSSGIPYSLIHGVETNLPARLRDFGVDSVLKDEYERMLKELSSANVTVFSLNTQSLITDLNVPSHQKGEATLQSISQYTGGRFLGNVQNYKENLDTVKAFTGTYYVLGYYVDESYDGRYHNIKVEVSRPGSKVFAQRGYFNPKEFSKYSTLEKELHLVDLALSEKPLLQSPIDIPMTALSCPIESEPGVCLLAKIPGNKVREKIGKEAEVYFLVFDDKDNIIELKRKAVEQSALEGKEALYYALMPLPPGAYKTSVVMRDIQTGESAVGRHMVEIPEPLEQGVQLLAPMLLIARKTNLYVRGYIPKSINADFPLLICFPFDPEHYSPIFAEIPKNTKTVQAVMHCSMPKLIKPVLKFEATLLDNSTAQARELSMTILSGKKEGYEGTLFAEFKMPKLVPGDYSLQITVLDVSSQERSQTAVALRIY